MNGINSEVLKQEILSAVANCRSETLDLFEILATENPKWEVFRSRLLRFFGDSPAGLSGKVTSAYSKNTGNGLGYERSK